MTREIKFRAWDKRVEKWIDNFRMFMHGNIEVFTSYGNPQWQPYSKEHYDLMQFTGLHDKNGKEIYESDVLRSYWNDGSVKDTFAVVFLEGCFCHMKDEKSGYMFDPKKCAIIGNIYSNPNLLTP